MIRRILFILIVMASMSIASAQNGLIGFGFRAGLSYSKLDGPSEMGPNGETLESYTNNGGFHIGGAVNFKFTDLVGMRLEFLYAQRGTKYEYNGPSYYVFGRTSGNTIAVNGMRHQQINVNNAYIDLPVIAYYKFGKLEVFGGFNSGILVASTGGGSIQFNGQPAFTTSLNHNYKSDLAGEASPTTKPVVVNGFNYSEPTYLGAYYDFDEKDKDLYKTLDFGLVGGLSYFLNEGLFVSARYVHGLGDVDRNTYDISLRALAPNGTFTPRADVNKSRSLQFSVGFSF